MAWWDFVKAVRKDGDEERKRDQQGGIKNRLLGVADDFLDTGEAAGKSVGRVAKSAGSEVYSWTGDAKQKKRDDTIRNFLKDADPEHRAAIVDGQPDLKKMFEDQGIDVKKDEDIDKFTMKPNDFVQDLAVDTARGFARVPETVARSFQEAQVGGVKEKINKKVLEVEEKIKALPDGEEKIKALEELAKVKEETSGDFDSAAPTDPIRKFLYGDTPVETYQTRAEGNREKIEGSRFRAGASVLAPLSGLLTVAGDVPGLGSSGKKLVENIAEESGEQGIKALLKSKFGKEVIEDIAPALAATKDKEEIAKIIASAAEKSGTAKEVASSIGTSSVTKNLVGDATRQTNPADEIASAVNPTLNPSLTPETPANPTNTLSDFLKPETPEAGADSLVSAVTPPGPGQRRFGILDTAEKSDQLTDATKQVAGQVNPQGYNTLNIDDSIKAASDRVSTDFEGTKKFVFDNLDAKNWDADTSSNAIALIKDANVRGDTALARELLERSAIVTKDSGQANVLWRSLVGSNTPDGMVKFAQGIVDDANEKAGLLTKGVRKVRGKGEYQLADDTIDFIKNETTKLAGMADGPEKDNVIKGIMEKVNGDIPPGATELFDAYRYNNMLSNPRTQVRNLLGNAIQTGITKPLTMGVEGGVDWFKAGLFGKDRQAYVKDVPQYYKNMLNSFGDAMGQFKKGWAGDIEQPDLKRIGAYRAESLPKALTVVGRAMEGTDRFFQTLISGGEFAVQKSRGLSDEAARKIANESAKLSLFRSATDARNLSGQGALLSKIDGITDSMQTLGQKHKSIRWAVPFIQTPMNMTKEMLKLSPAGFATLYKSKGAARNEQVAKALIGSAVMGVGAQLAASGNTTWSAPTDPEAREAFYSSGKKPFSIKIGDKWIPMNHFGPFGYALGIPAAVKDANDNGDIDESNFSKLGGILSGQAQFFTQQSYLQGINNFLNTVTGQEDATKNSSLAFTAGQVIPLSGLSRYVNSILDPVIRKKQGFSDTFKSDIPVLGAKFSKDNLEARTNIFSGEDMKRNASDFFGPYSIGKESSNPDDKEFQKGVGEFYDVKKTVGKQKKNVQEQVNEALSAGNTTEAYRIAREYNAWLQEQFTPWNDQYGGKVSDDLIKSYNGLKISTKGLTTRQKNLRKKKEDGTINYRQ